MFPPVIIMGMHRSGTSMITGLLEELGLLIGKRRQRNFEALFFLELNDWLLRQSGGAWDQPEPIRYLLANAEVRALVLDYIGYMLNSPRVISYLGWSNYLRYRSPQKLPIPWGWKDPRNTYALPLWLEMFPEARVLHVYRHGVDVSHSLQARMTMLLQRGETKHQRLGKRLRIYWFYARRAGFTDSLRCAASLEDSFSLWEAYMQEARTHVQSLGDRVMEIQYERFLAEPRSGLMQLGRFCGLDVNAAAVDQLAEGVDRSRAYAHRSDPELLEFAGKVSTRLDEWGY
jgi:hypothetical protein